MKKIQKNQQILTSLLSVDSIDDIEGEAENCPEWVKVVQKGAIKTAEVSMELVEIADSIEKPPE